MIGIVIISAVVTGLLGRYIGKQKGRSGSEGFWIGFLFSLLGVIIVALLPNAYKTEKKVIYEKDNTLNEIINETSKPAKTSHLTKSEQALLEKEEKKKNVKANIRLTLILLIMFGGVMTWVYLDEKQENDKTKEVVKIENENILEKKEEKINSQKKKIPEQKKPVKPKSSKPLSLHIESLIKTYDKLIIRDFDVKQIAKTFITLNKNTIESLNIIDAKGLEIIHNENSINDDYYSLLFYFKDNLIYESSPFKAKLTAKGFDEIKNKTSYESKNYEDLFIELGLSKSVINAIEIDMRTKGNINPRQINKVEVLKTNDYTIDLKFYDKQQFLGSFKSIIPSSLIENLIKGKIYSKELE